MTFQKTVNLYPAPGKEGNFASMNPTAVALPPEGSYKAGADGVYQSRFVWPDGADPTLVNNTGAGLPLGYIMNTGKGTIPVGQAGSMAIGAGVDLAVYTKGDWWVKPTTAATVGQKIFATLADGTIQTGTAGAIIADAIETPWSVASAGDANSLIKMTTWGL